MLKQTRNIFVSFFIFLFFILTFSQSVFALTDANKFKDGIKVVIDDNYPPYVFRDSKGNLQGILIDQWNLWQKKTGIEVNIYGMEWDVALQKMKDGEFDVIDTVFFNEERSKYLDFTRSYAQINVPIFFQKNISGITDAESLKDFNIGVKKGDNVIKILKEKGVNNLLEFKSFESIAEAAKNQGIAVFVMDEPPAMYYLYKLGIQDKFHNSDPLYTGELHRAVLKGNSELLNTVERGFSLISQNEYTNINKKWFGAPQINPKVLTGLGIAFSIALAVVILLIFWNLILDRTVKAKTMELSDALEKLKESEEKCRSLIANLNIGVAVFSPEGEFLMYNQKFLEFALINDKVSTGISLENIIKYYINDKGESISKEDLPNFKVLSTGKPERGYTIGVKNPDTDDVVWTNGEAMPEFDSDGKLSKIILTVVDITERKKVEMALRESENRVSAFLRAIPDLFFLLDRDGRFIDFYAESADRLFYVPDELIGKNVKEVFDGNISSNMLQSIETLFNTGKTQTVEYSLIIGGSKAFFEARLVLCGEDNVLAVVRDVSQRKESEARLYNMSIHDAPTGLYNRYYFENVLDRCQNEGILGTGVVICDIDGLKLVNDTLGHAAGDEYLKTAADIICKSFRNEDIVARIGGDEFAVLMKSTDTNEISSIKLKIDEMLNALNSEERVIPISMSLGYAIGNGKQTDLRKLLKIADEMMYHEKLHHRQSEKSKNIDILTKMLEARDFITEGHGERMQELSSKLAETLGMTENEIKDMCLFAQFHDIGKVGIPDRILFKPGKLSEEEMNEMKRHTEIGYRIAEASPDLIHISEWILKHHEWWNGCGYPFKLKGEKIPIQCRILSIVDAFDAMTSNRPYRNAIPKERAVEEITRFKGIQFDPELVDKFVELVNNIK